jgi:hypothetical protein
MRPYPSRVLQVELQVSWRLAPLRQPIERLHVALVYQKQLACSTSVDSQDRRRNQVGLENRYSPLRWRALVEESGSWKPASLSRRSAKRQPESLASSLVGVFREVALPQNRAAQPKPGLGLSDGMELNSRLANARNPALPGALIPINQDSRHRPRLEESVKAVEHE